MKYLFFTIAFLSPIFIYSQSVYVLDTDKAFSIGPEFNNFDEIRDIGLRGGYSLNGRTDLYFKLSSGTFVDDGDLSRFQLTLGADYYLLKQNSGTSISWSFGGSLAPYKFNSDEFQGLDISLTGTEIILGTDIYKSINLSSLRIIPNIGLGYNINKITAKSGNDKESETESRFIISAGIDLDFNAGKNKIVIGPEVLFSEGYRGFGISLHYILIK